MGEFDNAFKMLDELEYEMKNEGKSEKDYLEDITEEKFNLRIEEYFKDEKSSDFIGKYDDYVSNATERVVRFKSFLDDCVEASKNKILKENDKLYMNQNHAKKLLDEAQKLFAYQDRNICRIFRKDQQPSELCRDILRHIFRVRVQPHPR